MSESLGFNASDAGQLIDLLNPDNQGADRPKPVNQLLCCLVRVTTQVTAATCTTPGTGVGRMLITSLVAGVEPFLDRIIWEDSTISINLRSWRNVSVPIGTILIARREQLRNEWTI